MSESVPGGDTAEAEIESLWDNLHQAQEAEMAAYARAEVAETKLDAIQDMIDGRSGEWVISPIFAAAINAVLNGSGT